MARQLSDFEGVASSLLEAGLRGPHEFIRTLNAHADRADRARSIVSAAKAPGGFALASGHGADERWLLGERLTWDSEFFGYGVARIHGVWAPGRQLALREDVKPGVRMLQAALPVMRGRGIRYVFSTVDATDLAGLRTLTGAGFDVIETRVHYHMPLVGAPVDRHPTRLATPADIPSLSAVAAGSVNHFDRFHADPFIAPADADRLMAEWVRASVAGGFADATVVIDEPDPLAFCTAKYHRERWDDWGLRLAQPVLSAVSPERRGWYVKIISELNEHLRSIGAEHSWLVTQITNNAVVRSWEKLGYGFGKGEHVLRVTL